MSKFGWTFQRRRAAAHLLRLRGYAARLPLRAFSPFLICVLGSCVNGGSSGPGGGLGGGGVPSPRLFQRGERTGSTNVKPSAGFTYEIEDSFADALPSPSRSGATRREIATQRFALHTSGIMIAP